MHLEIDLLDVREDEDCQDNKVFVRAGKFCFVSYK